MVTFADKWGFWQKIFAQQAIVSKGEGEPRKASSEKLCRTWSIF